jgi:hypothetical protein
MIQNEQPFNVVVKTLERCLRTPHRAKLMTERQFWAARPMVAVLEAAISSLQRKKPA